MLQSHKQDLFRCTTPTVSILAHSHLMSPLMQVPSMNPEHMHETIWIFEQTPPPHFYLKVVYKKGGCIFQSLHYVLAWMVPDLRSQLSAVVSVQAPLYVISLLLRLRQQKKGSGSTGVHKHSYTGKIPNQET